MRRLVVLAVFSLVCSGALRAEEIQAPDGSSELIEQSIFMKTLGGRQFWGDVAFFRGWRIQQHVYTKHYRLLDPSDCRHESGTLDACRAKLEAIKAEQKLEPMSGKAVILIHGLIRSSKSFTRLRRELEQQGYIVVPFDYPSTRVEVPVAAELLRKVVDSLEGVEQIDLVVHSMGGIVVRCLLSRGQEERFHRMVMLGVPNRGAHIAQKFKKNFMFKLVFGPGGQQLALDAKFVDALPTPEFEFGVITGARGKPNGFNPLLPGDDDGVVAVESTRLPGAVDSIEVPCLHSFLMQDPTVVTATRRFLETGCFREDGNRQPIPVIAEEATMP